MQIEQLVYQVNPSVTRSSAWQLVSSGTPHLPEALALLTLAEDFAPSSAAQPRSGDLGTPSSYDEAHSGSDSETGTGRGTRV